MEVSELAEKEDTEEGSFKEQYGQEGSKLSISSRHLWGVHILEQHEQGHLMNSFSHTFDGIEELHHCP